MDKTITPTAMYNMGWTPTQFKDGSCEVWVRPGKECLYSRSEQKIKQVRRVTAREH